MNFNKNSKFFKSAFNNFNFNKTKTNSNFSSSSTFKTFFTINMQRNISFLNSIYKNNSNGLMLLNNVHKKNYITIESSSTMKKSIAFLFNDSSSNGGLSVITHKLDSDFLTLLNEIIKLDEQILENGR
jgi:hypothetical protein